MPTQKTCFERIFERHEKSNPPLNREFYFKFKPIGMKHGLILGRRKKDRPGLKQQWELVVSIVSKGRKTENWLVVPGFLWFISIILFVIFLRVNAFFPILCIFTHISSQALDFLYCIPLLNGNDTFTHRYSIIQICCK